MSGSMGDTEATILNVIRSKRDMGIGTAEIKEATNLSTTIINRSLNNLLTRDLIKQVVDIHNKRKKLFMGVEFEPCKEIGGGDWYGSDGKLDQALINELRQSCLECMPATADRIHNALMKKTKNRDRDVSGKQIGEVLELMVLEDEIEEVKSSGVGDCRSIYRRKREKAPRMGALASTPCGVCPRIGSCAADGVISPATCEYYTKWLNIKF